MVKNPPANVGDRGWIPGLGRSPQKGKWQLSVLAWKIPWTEEPGRLQSVGSQKSWTQLSDGTTTNVPAHSLTGISTHFYRCERKEAPTYSVLQDKRRTRGKGRETPDEARKPLSARNPLVGQQRQILL